MSDERRIRVLVVDDHPVARFGLRGLIDDQPDLQVVGEARNGAQAVTVFRELAPDVVVMDLRMPGLDGIQATAAIVREAPGARVLILSSYDTEADVARVQQAGAAGFIMKEAEPEEILGALRTVAAGGRYLPPALQARVDEGGGGPGLGARHLRVLQHIGEGLSNKEIAAKIGLSSGTVRIYVSEILERLGAGNRAEAVTRAIRRGIIRPPR